MNYNEQLFQFIKNSPSMFHAISTMVDELSKHGYELLNETKAWNLSPGKKYMVTRNQSSMIAFQMPTTADYHYQIIASHSDSPCFLLKPNPEIKSGAFVKLNVELYGGMLINSWFDRPLSLAGRIMVKENGKIISRLVNLDQDLLVIPNLAIHMNRDANQGVRIEKQNDILPLYAMDDHQDIIAYVAAEMGIDKGQIISHELYLYNRQSGTVLGNQETFIGCPKLDNLQSAFTSMIALIEGKNENCVNMICSFDNEEIGSGTRQGADSQFLSSVIERINESFHKSKEENAAILAKSFFISCDNAHSFHPNYAYKSDPNNQVFMNQGIVIKHSARKAYTSDAFSSAVFKEICKLADVPVQDFVNHNEVPGGGTLGAISSSHVSIPSIDIGLAQLAMHSCYEVAGAHDTAFMIKALTTYFSHSIILSDDGEGLIR